MASDKPKKRFYKRWWFWVIVVVIVIIIAIASSGSGDDSSSSSSSTSTSNSSSSQQASSSQPASGIDKVDKINFSDTSGQQTTTVDQAEIKDVSDQNIVSNNIKNIKYAIVIHMTVANQANDTANAFPEQGHIVLPDGTQIDGTEDQDAQNVFNSGDIEKGAKVTGNVYFPITDNQAKSISKAQFKFEVICGDDNMTDKNYSVDLSF